MVVSGAVSGSQLSSNLLGSQSLSIVFSLISTCPPYAYNTTSIIAWCPYDNYNIIIQDTSGHNSLFTIIPSLIFNCESVTSKNVSRVCHV